MLDRIIGAIAGPLVDKILGPFLKLGESYFNKQISIEELRARMVTVLVTSAAEVEQTHAQELTKTYAAFMAATEKSVLMKAVWASVTLSQLFVLLWHQLGIPFLCYTVGEKSCYPSSGTTTEWAYILLGACVGLGPIVLRAGPGAPDPNKWKTLIQK